MSDEQPPRFTVEKDGHWWMLLPDPGPWFSVGPLRLESYGTPGHPRSRLVIELHSDVLAEELSKALGLPVLAVPSDPHMEKLDMLVQMAMEARK